MLESQQNYLKEVIQLKKKEPIFLYGKKPKYKKLFFHHQQDKET